METKQPINVRCQECSHEWVAAYLPMDMAKFAKLMKSAHCPMCGSKKAVLAKNEPLSVHGA